MVVFETFGLLCMGHDVGLMVHFELAGTICPEAEHVLVRFHTVRVLNLRYQKKRSGEALLAARRSCPLYYIFDVDVGTNCLSYS